MPDMNMNRRTVIASTIAAASMAVSSDAAADEKDDLTPDQQFVIGAGLTRDEAECWKKTAEAAAAFFKLPNLHPMDRQEVASAIHVLQNKLLGRPTYRKYLELAKASRQKAP